MNETGLYLPILRRKKESFDPAGSINLGKLVF